MLEGIAEDSELVVFVDEELASTLCKDRASMNLFAALSSSIETPVTSGLACAREKNLVAFSTSSGTGDSHPWTSIVGQSFRCRTFEVSWPYYYTT